MSIEESITTILGQIKEGKLSEVPALLSQIQGEPLNSPQLGTEQSDPENVALRALIHAQRGDLDQAFELLLPVVQKQPKTPYLQWALQWLDRPEAKNAIKKERFYGFIAYLINQFATLNRDKQSRECTLEPMPTLIAKLRETQPPDADLLVVSVSLLRRLGFVDQALEYANLAYEMEPSFRSATARAVAYESLKKPDEALEAYRDAMKLEPNEVSIRLSMGDLLWEYGRRDEAEELYQDALSLEPM